jgi:5'-3' exonuclease
MPWLQSGRSNMKKSKTKGRRKRIFWFGYQTTSSFTNTMPQQKKQQIGISKRVVNSRKGEEEVCSRSRGGNREEGRGGGMLDDKGNDNRQQQRAHEVLKRNQASHPA